jgi:transposase-like protein
MKVKKTAHNGAFKFKVAIASIRGDKTIAELCQEYGVVSSQIYKWRKELLDHGSDIFDGQKGKPSSDSSNIDALHATIGRLKVENDFLEKVLGRSR